MNGRSPINQISLVQKIHITQIKMKNKLILVLLSISLLLSFGIIAVLITALNISEKRLNIIGDTMEEMAVQHIITEVTVNEDIPLNSDITVTDKLKVNINMILKTTIPFTAEIPVNENMLIPYNWCSRLY
jgi:hypothetical protein